MTFERPNIRQIPFKYHTEAHGPVFAYRAQGEFAECVTHLDATVTVHRDALLPFDANAEGVELVSDLEWDVLDMMSPQTDGNVLKYRPTRKSKIGGYIFTMPHIWNSIVS